MIRICSELLTVLLRIIFEQSLKEGRFPKIWKKANVVPVHKREDYLPISLLPIYSKLFERVIYKFFL